MNVSSNTIPSSPSLFDQLFSDVFRSPIAQMRSAFPDVDVGTGFALETFVLVAQIISAALSVAIVIGIIIVIRRSRLLHSAVETVGDFIAAELPHDVIAERWNTIEGMLSSDRPNDWKLAVIDADKLLEFSLQHLPLGGETLGEKLKEFDRSELSVIDDVWRAHKLRNLLIHGDRSEVSRDEARKAVGSIGKALRELSVLA